MPVDSLVKAQGATLDVALRESPLLEKVGVHPRFILNAVQRLNSVSGLASAIALDFKPDAFAGERHAQFEPTVLRLHFGSDLNVIFSLEREVCESVAALSFLIWALKRAWGLDLEIKTYREEQKRKFAEARRLALKAERELQEEGGVPVVSTKPPPTPHPIEAEQGWGPGTMYGSHWREGAWEAQQASLFIDFE